MFNARSPSNNTLSLTSPVMLDEMSKTEPGVEVPSSAKHEPPHVLEYLGVVCIFAVGFVIVVKLMSDSFDKDLANGKEV